MSSASLGSRTRRRMKFPSFVRSRKTVAVMSLSLSIIGFVGGGCSIQVKTFHDREYCGRQEKKPATGPISARAVRLRRETTGEHDFVCGGGSDVWRGQGGRRRAREEFFRCRNRALGKWQPAWVLC